MIGPLYHVAGFIMRRNPPARLTRDDVVFAALVCFVLFCFCCAVLDVAIVGTTEHMKVSRSLVGTITSGPWGRKKKKKR